MFRLALRTLRFRATHFVGIFTAVFCGAAIIMACGGLMETGIRLNAQPERLQVPIVISSRTPTTEKARIDSTLLKKIEAQPGVDHVIPDLSFAAEIEGWQETTTGLYGHPWASAGLTPHVFVAGAEPSQKTDIVIREDAARRHDIKIGSTVTARIKGESITATVSGIIKTDTPYNNAPLMFFSNSFMTSLIDAIGVIPHTGIDSERLAGDLKRTLTTDDVEVLSGNERGLGEYRGISGAREVLIAGSAPFGGNTIVVVIFVVASILGLSIRQRGREIALLQTIGATPNQVRWMIIVEVMAVSVVAVLAAIIPATWLGEWMLSALQASGLVPQQLIFYQGIIPVSIGVAVGIISSFIASLIAARRATNIQPIEALADIATQRQWFSWWRVVLAVIGLAGGLSLALVTAFVMHGAIASSTAGPAILPWLLSFSLLAPALVLPGITAMSLPLQTFKHGIGYLAFKNMSVRYVQSAAIVTPIMLASSMVLSMLYQQTTLTTMAERAYTESIQADTFLAARGNGVSITTADKLHSVPGVEANTPLVISGARVVHGDDQPEKDALRILGVDSRNAGSILKFDFTEGALNNLQEDGIALSENVALRLNRKLGDTVSLRLGDGRDEQLALTAIYRSPAGFDSGTVSAELLARHTNSGLVSLVALKTNLTKTELEHRIQSRLPEFPFTILGPDALRQTISTQMSVLSWVNTLFASMVTLYALLFLTNTLIIALIARRREFALQQLIGSSKREIITMIVLETAVLAVIGVIMGALVSSVSLVPFSIAVNGTPFAQGPVSIALGVIAGSLLLSVMVAIATTLYTLKAKSIVAVSNRE